MTPMGVRWRWWWLVLAWAGGLGAACTPGGVQNAGAPARVLAVIDGDTLAVDAGAGEQRVRLIGIDAPEAPHRGRPGQPGHRQATAFLREVVGQSQVRLRADPLVDDTDRYGRLLRHVLRADGSDVARELLAAGLVTVYPRFAFEEIEDYVATEQQARAAGRGLWQENRVARIGWLEAPEHVGEVVRVEGTIVGGRCLRRICFLNFHRDYKRHLSLVIFEPVRDRFPAEPDAYYRGREVVVTGRITPYRGRPQILLSSADQIRILPKVNPRAPAASYE